MANQQLLSSIKCLRNEMFLNGRVCQQIEVNSDCRRKELIKKIENIVLKTVRSAAGTTCVPTLRLRPRRSQWKDCNFDRRELYYEQTELFENQATVNAALLDICCLLEASPWELRVLSTSKGLVAGPLTITTADKEVIDCSKPGGMLVPQDVKGILKIDSSAVFILVVEKDAAFQKLLDDGAHMRLGPCIIITGKGEPDVNTRLLVHRLCRELAIPVLIVVDADPYGIEIMCTYRFGSLSLIQLSDHLAVTEVRWVGIHPTDIDKFSIPTVPFTNKDFAKARDLASRPYIQQNEELLEQVNCLLQCGKKCEIENLAALSPTFLTDMFLSYKISSKEVI